MPGSEMGKFTRILHSGKPDSLMEEIPTFKISPTWMNLSLRMKDDPATDQAFGWVLEMSARCDYNLKGELTYGKIGEWHFNKRSHLSGPPLSVPESVVRLVQMVNEATANIPNWDTL
ncbi:phosphoesterase family protein [Hibiscus syriacus]|uniref:Phosphoesterase family protein n=1 Tax=Hibiscus syriacus TaxID=106335 RepID=A0A6A2XHF2_HIBSY|nr:phosphoesterase family protein [Hibiscus syriacus]